MSDLPERLRRLYVQAGTDYVQEAADEIERLRTALRDMRDRAEAAEEDAMPDDLARELDRLRHENGDRGNQIINLRRELADMSVISGIDDRYAGRLAFMLECLIVDYHGNWDAACALLDEYKAAWEAVNPSPPTFMGEPMPAERRELLEKLRNDRAEIAQKLRADHEEMARRLDAIPGIKDWKERGR